MFSTLTVRLTLLTYRKIWGPAGPGKPSSRAISALAAPACGSRY